ncbi:MULTISPECIES: helix-turn-helix domain-containing protein [Okeania]|uniref:Transcriptional regulator n=1 Tax=Okeania hirsuta TaxID=1458930 RepID=A0A3N6QR19_9CYAN|nr:MULTISPECIES: transcriptional regulator [Okeania]NES88121.1 transcriptional regulator [Okeania sp. SIO2B9]NET74626.1 transcriptional regulator [Okeania sp. SIO1F9]RQH17941.1 transcriptional regulator [Okeania hirsuta]RQH46431.1 transcriptional regulator [Okeania hirsuta]
MTLTFDEIYYRNLLIKFTPKVIETELEYEAYLAVLEEFTFAKNLTQEEKALYKLLVLLVENYETENYPMTPVEPYEILQHLIVASGISQQDLVGIIGSDEVVSQLMDGKLSLNNWQSKALADYFQISPTIFQL